MKLISSFYQISDIETEMESFISSELSVEIRHYIYFPIYRSADLVFINFMFK